MRALYAALRTYLEMYVGTYRMTGRTAKLVEAAQPNDWIIVARGDNIRELEYRLRQAGKPKVRITAVSSLDDLMCSADSRGMMERGGRVLFDHEAIEQIYRAALTSVENGMDAFERAVTRGDEPTRPPGDVETPMYLTDRLRRGLGGEWKP